MNFMLSNKMPGNNFIKKKITICANLCKTNLTRYWQNMADINVLFLIKTLSSKNKGGGYTY